MATDNIKTQVLLELSLQQLIEGSSDYIIKQILPLYMRKLNCFMAAIITDDNDEFVIPHAMKNSDLWNDLKRFFHKKNNEIAQLNEYHSKHKFIYAYALPKYGWLFLGKNRPFSVEIKNELVKLIAQLGRSLRQVREEERLKLLQSLINNSSDAIQVARESGQLYYINHLAAERLGIAQQDVQNYYVKDFEVKYNDDERWRKHLEALKQVDFLTGEGVNVNQKTGASFPVEVTTKYVEVGNEGFVIASSRDISSRKEAERQLASAKNAAEQASRAKEIFLANMSHEIRTPLNVIIGMIRQLSKEKLDGKQLYYVNQSATSANHLLAILNNILDMAKIEAGEVVIENKDFSIQSLADNIQSILSSQSSEKGLDFRLSISADIKPALVGDDVRIRQILINLLDNSIKFTEEGYVSLSVSAKETSETHQLLQFEIIDSGIGMSESYIAEIFELFSQEDATANRKFGGTGLGFTIANDLLKLMGSELELSSTKGKGTQIGFKLRLPIGDPDAVTGQTATAKPMALEGFNVLLVEDNEMNRFIAQHSLSYLGCTVSEAENGKEAVTKVKETDFDLILMDIQMPEMNGLEATQHIRNELKKNTPIIALTANAFKHDIDNYMAEGMNDYIIKPYDEQDLYRKLNHFFELKKQSAKSESPEPGKNNLEKLYDLKTIREMSRGNDAFVQKMLNIFVNVVAENVKVIKDALNEKDIIAINKTAHKIKPSIDQMGIVELKETVRTLEKFSLKSSSEEELRELVGFLTDTLLNISDHIKVHEMKD